MASLASVAPLDRYLSRASASPQSYALQLECAVVLRERELHYCALYPPGGRSDGRAPAEDGPSWEPWPATAEGLAHLRALRDEATTDHGPFDLFGVKAVVADALGVTLLAIADHGIGRALYQQFELDLGRRQPWPTPLSEAEYQALSAAWSRLAHDARAHMEGLTYLRHCLSEHDLVRDAQRAQRAVLASATLPPALAPLRPLAVRYGLADDGLRAAAIAASTPSQRRTLVHRVRASTPAIDAFTLTFGSGHCPPAVAAFFYLRLAAEETCLRP